MTKDWLIWGSIDYRGRLRETSRFILRYRVGEMQYDVIFCDAMGFYKSGSTSWTISDGFRYTGPLRELLHIFEEVAEVLFEGTQWNPSTRRLQLEPALYNLSVSTTNTSCISGIMKVLYKDWAMDGFIAMFCSNSSKSPARSHHPRSSLSWAFGGERGIKRVSEDDGQLMEVDGTSCSTHLRVDLNDLRQLLDGVKCRCSLG